MMFWLAVGIGSSWFLVVPRDAVALLVREPDRELSSSDSCAVTIRARPARWKPSIERAHRASLGQSRCRVCQAQGRGAAAGGPSISYREVPSAKQRCVESVRLARPIFFSENVNLRKGHRCEQRIVS